MSENDTPETVDVASEEQTVEVVDGVDQPRTEADLVVEQPLSDEEREVQEKHEALAAELGPGETLPWVAEPPSGVALERAVAAADGTDAEEEFPADEEAEGTGSDVDSSRTDRTTTQPENAEEPEDTDTRST